MSQRWFVGTALILVFAAGAGGWLLGRISTGTQRADSRVRVLGKAPSYQGLTDQLNRTVDSDQFKGKVQVITFLFTYCDTYCPLITVHLVGFENLLKSLNMQDKVQLVAFNVDPADTGPKQMRAYLKQYGWDPENLHWQFLTGEPETIRHIVTGGYHMAYAKVREGDNEDGSSSIPQPTVVNRLARKANVDYDVTHNDGLVVVDPKGRIRKIYTQADMVSRRQLLRQVERLLPGPNAFGSAG